MYDYTKQTYLNIGDRVKMELPYSEVCMHMRVAGKVMTVELCQQENMLGEKLPGTRPMAQLYREDGLPFSAPITLGEGGFYEDQTGYYYYPPKENE